MTAKSAARPALPPFWSLVERHGDELLSHARRLAGADAEDVLHDALLRALRAYDRLEHGEHLRAWLLRVVSSAAADARRGRRREVLVSAPPDAPRPEPAPDGFPALVAALPPGTRAALELRFVDDLPYAAIARALHCSPDAARQRVSAGVRRLRSEVRP